MAYAKKQWVNGEKITQEALNNIENGIYKYSLATTALDSHVVTLKDTCEKLENRAAAAEESIAENTSEIESTNQLVNAQAKKVSKNTANISALSDANTAQINSLNTRINDLQEQVLTLKRTNVVEVNPTEETANLNQPEADLVLTTTPEAPITKATTITAKTVTLKEVETKDIPLTVKATSDITLKGFANEGDLPKATSNAAVKLKSDDYVTITGSTFNQTGHNSIEICLAEENYVPEAKNILIDSCNFTAPLSNNAISVFSQQEGAVITISNCHFSSVSNCVRLSNYTNTHATFNFINCTCDKWDEGEYAGFVIMQDYNSASAEEAKKENRFAKLKLNFVNVVGPDGKVIKPTNLGDVCSGGTSDQVIYVYSDKEGLIPYNGNEDRYPEVTFA